MFITLTTYPNEGPAHVRAFNTAHIIDIAPASKGSAASVQAAHGYAGPLSWLVTTTRGWLVQGTPQQLAECCNNTALRSGQAVTP